MKRRLLRVIALGLALGLCIPSVSSYAKSSERVEVSDEDFDESDEMEDTGDGVEEEGDVTYDEDIEDDDLGEEFDGTKDMVEAEEDEYLCEDEDTVKEDIVSDFIEVDEEEILPDEVSSAADESIDIVEDVDCDSEDGSEVSANAIGSWDDYDCSDSCESVTEPYIEVDSVVLHYDDGTNQKIPSKEVYSDGSLTVPCSCRSRGTYEDSSNTLHKYRKSSLMKRVSAFLEGMDVHYPEGLLKVGSKKYKIVSCKMGGKYSHKTELESGKDMVFLDTRIGEMNHTYFGGSFVETIGGVTVDVFAVPEDMADGLFTSEYVEGRF